MLKKLSLQGFKSFPDKTELEFPKGITAIVGPNGSGKSNVVDAIRWVLGEQSLKNIRLGKSEDVLFSGTPERPASGLATVELTFDNTGRLFPDERLELSVGRRLYRDGTSAYLLNQEEVRLKEIVRLMAAGKLGTRGLAIITQGEGDAFLTASVSARRAMLEEAVGLKEYRLKKEEAERKMEETKSNLEKTDALIAEIVPHLRSLKRQVARWERRQAKAEELRDLEQKYFHWRLSQIEHSSNLTGELAVVAREIAALQREIKALEERRAKAENDLAALGQAPGIERLAEVERVKEETLRILGNVEGKIETIAALPGPEAPAAKQLLEVLTQTRDQLAEVLAFGSDWERARPVIQKALEAIENVLLPDLRGRAPDAGQFLEKEKEALLARLTLLEKEAVELRRESEAGRREREQAMTDLKNVFSELDAKRQILTEKQELTQEYRLETEKRRLQEEDLAAKLREAGWDYGEFRGAHLGIPAPQIGEIGEIEVKISRLRRELADIGSVDEELVRECRETQERHDFLEKERADLTRALQDLESLRKELDKKIDQEFRAALKRVNAQLQHYFRLLFGGGNARLVEPKRRIKKLRGQEGNGGAEALLPSEGAVVAHEDELAIQELDEPQPDEAGIEIEVDLPRKKIKSLDMLSGGERALTAIALVFAVAGASSPPFLILDEIDASLDEPNSQRFGELLKELAARTQFILITHNRVTMEAADVLYGVTMRDSASKTFSLKFQEAEKIAAAES